MIVFCGDVHNYDNLILYIESIKLDNCSLIQVGDFGVGFERKRIKDYDRIIKLDEFLINKNIKLYVLRGNHDDPSFFSGNDFETFTNIEFVPDYTIKNIENKSILFIGGAISVDRKPNPKIPYIHSPSGTWQGRFENIDYWKNEKLIFNEKKLRSINNIDIVVTHTCPTFVQPIQDDYLNKWIEYDPSLGTEVFQERSFLSDAYFILKQKNKIKNWYYGHFHFSNTEEYDNTLFKLLDIMEFVELRE